MSARRTSAARPPGELAAGPVTLVRYQGGEAVALFQVVTENLEHLRPWMPWAATPPSVRAQGEFVRRSMAEWDAGEAFNFWMREEGTGGLVGGAGLHHRVGDRLEIGYWVSESRTRRGYATAAARALTSAALDLPGVNRVEIHCDEANVASAGVPRRLGYRLVRIHDVPVAAPSETGRHMVWEVDAGIWRQAAASPDQRTRSSSKP